MPCYLLNVKHILEVTPLPPAQPSEILTPAEIAKANKFDPETVRRLFRDEPGVIKLGHPRKGRKKPYFTLRIPRQVYDRVMSRMTVTAGGAAK